MSCLWAEKCSSFLCFLPLGPCLARLSKILQLPLGSPVSSCAWELFLLHCSPPSLWSRSSLSLPFLRPCTLSYLILKCVCMCVCVVTQLCLTLCDPVDYSLPVSSVRGILQSRILEWVAISFSRESSQPRDRTWVSCIAGRRFFLWAIVMPVT